jgi:hypothetical protein
MATKGRPYHLLEFMPEYRDSLGYFIVHEAEHIIRLYSVPDNRRKMPAIGREQTREVVYELKEHLLRQERKGMPETLLTYLFEAWHQGLVRQLTNIPVDMRIERRIKENYAGLGSIQRKALKEELRLSYLALKPGVQALTPPKVYDASNSMNSAFAIYLSWLLNDRRLAQPFRNTKYWKTGHKLAEPIWETEDRGHVGDIEAIDAWTGSFGMQDWFEWTGWAELEQFE